MRNPLLLYYFCLCAVCAPSFAMELSLQPALKQCGVQTFIAPQAPSSAASRIPNSQLTHGLQDIALAWLTSPTQRYPHAVLGSRTHAGSVQVQLRSGSIVSYELPLNRVFEDLVPRLVDLDQDGKDELILIESDALYGSSLVVLGIKERRLQELARSPPTGSTFRWLNPVGMADFDGDEKLDLAAVTTPHIGGVLTLYRYQPPHLLPFSKTTDVSNHSMGSIEQRLAVIVQQARTHPTIIIPDISLKALHALRWDAGKQLKELSEVTALPASVQQLTPMPNGACALLVDQSWWRVTLHR